MKAKIDISQDISFNDIILNDYEEGEMSLTQLLDMIHNKVSNVVMDISIKRQRDDIDLEDIDSPLHSVLNLLERIK